MKSLVRPYGFPFGFSKNGFGKQLAAVLAIVGLLIAPTSAFASGATLTHSLGEIVQSPLDLVLSPISAGVQLVKNLRDIDDSMLVRIVYTLPGYVWLVGLNVGASILRGVAGALELVPGVILLFFPNQTMDPLFAPVERAPALIQWDNPLSEEPVFLQYIPGVNLVTVSPKFGIAYFVAEY